MDHMTEEVDLANREAAVEHVLEETRLTAGIARPFDAAGMRTFIECDFDRSGGYLGSANHSVLFDISEAWRERLPLLIVPLLVIHGKADPVFPLEHGEALARSVTSARLLTLAGGGHELHPVHWDIILDALIAHSGGAKHAFPQQGKGGKTS